MTMYLKQHITVQQFAVEHSHSCDSADELEVRYVFLVSHPRQWVDLEGVVITEISV